MNSKPEPYIEALISLVALNLQRGQTVKLMIIGCELADNFLKGAIKTLNNG